MDKIRKFDKELEKACDGAFFAGKASAYMLCVLGTMFMMIPAELHEVLTGVVWMGCILCACGVNQYMHPYLKIREGDKYVSVYKKLKYMPVTKSEIRKVRFSYLKHFCIPLCTINFLIQQLSSFLNHSFGTVSVLFAAVWTVVVWAVGISAIYFS